MHKLLIVVGSLFFFAVAEAQNRFISFGVADGLSQNSVTAIYQDKDGLLWLGTQDGLNSFDGRNFKNYKYNENDTTTISDQFVLSITGDADGFLWIATRNGYNRFNKRTGKFERYFSSAREKSGLGRSTGFVQQGPRKDVLADCGDTLMVLRTTATNFTRIPLVGFSRHPAIDKTGNIWGFDTSSHLLFASHENNFTTHIRYPVPTIVPAKGFIQTTIGADGILWCYAENGLVFFFDTHTKQWRKEFLTLPSSINHILVSKNGWGWISTLDGIYLVKDKKTYTHLKPGIQPSNGLPPGNILCVYEDNQDNIWIGSANAGFAYYHPAFDHFSLLHTGISNDAVTGVVSFGDEKWIGSSSGLHRLQQNKTTHLFKNKKIAALVKDKQYNIWIAIPKEGLYQLNREGKTRQVFTQDNLLLQTKNILHLLCDSRGRIWVCTERGFFIYDPQTKQWSSFYGDQRAHQSSTGWYVLNAFEDASHRVWICKQGGIEVYDQSLRFLFSITSENNTSQIRRTLITGCTQDLSGTIWIATLSNGVYTYKDKLLQHYTTADGLSSNIIYGITRDKKGRIWTTTTSGISVFSPPQQRFFTLNETDGLPVSDYVLGALATDEEGNVLAGSSNGLLVIKADEIRITKKKVYAYVREVSVDGKNVTGSQQPLLLHSGYKAIGFEFSLNQSIQPSKVMYQYRLKGTGETWTTLPPGSSQISFSSLPFKKITLQVRAAYSAEDLASAPVYEYPVDVQPAFWQTKWFMGLMIVCGIALIAWLVQLYNRKKYKRQTEELQLQKKLQQERERIGRDLHDNIGAYTSALIAGIQHIKSSNEAEGKDLDELSENASNIMGYLRETIWVLNHEAVSLTAFCDRFDEYAKRIIKYYPAVSLQLTEEITQERSLTPEVSLHLFRILQEALQNACKHSDASSIEVLFRSDERMAFSVADNGKGLSDEVKLDAYGLQSMRGRAAETGFGISVQSEKGFGTTVLLVEK